MKHITSSITVSRLAAVASLLSAAAIPVFAQGNSQNALGFEAPTVFQAAGPTAGSIQGAVDQFRAALGTNNGNAAGPLQSGRREINWDGGGSTATSVGPANFTVFLNNRGGLFTTPGSGFVQAPPSGIADTFGNSAYNDIFQAFSPVRLFVPIGSNVTEARFFVPGSNGGQPAAVDGFGVVFTDVDQPDGDGPAGKLGNRGASTLMEFYNTQGEIIFSSFVPASPGNASLSFFAIKFPDARIARVRIFMGNTALGPDDGRLDVVAMDDFIYGEPKAIR